MAGDARLAEARDLFIRQDAQLFKGVGDFAQAGAEDHAQPGPGPGEGLLDDGQRSFKGFAVDHGIPFSAGGYIKNREPVLQKTMTKPCSTRQIMYSPGVQRKRSPASASPEKTGTATAR